MTKGRLGKDWDNDLSNIDEGNIVKGLFYGVAFSIPLWIIIFALVGFL